MFGLHRHEVRKPVKFRHGRAAVITPGLVSRDVESDPPHDQASLELDAKSKEFKPMTTITYRAAGPPVALPVARSPALGNFRRPASNTRDLFRRGRRRGHFLVQGRVCA